MASASAATRYVRIPYNRISMAIGLACAAASGQAAAQEPPADFPAFLDGAFIPAKYVDPLAPDPVHVANEDVDRYAKVASDEFCKGWAAPHVCELTSIARRSVAGEKPSSGYSKLDVTVDVTLNGNPVKTEVSSFGIVLVQSCPGDAILIDDHGHFFDNRDETTGATAVACTSPDALPKGASLGIPAESGANQCPIGNAPTVGNPINPLTLSKIETVIDYAGPVASGLVFARTYHSGAFSLVSALGQFGRYPAGARMGARWRHSWDRAFVRRPYFDRSGFVYATALHLVKEDGSESRFVKKGDSFIPVEGERGTLREHPEGGWVYTWADFTVELYDDQGRLRTRTDPNGNTVALHYDEIEVGIGLKAKVLTRVSDRQGRELVLSYDRLGRIETVDQPDGGRIEYAYSGDILEGLDANLVDVTYPGGRNVRYLYDEAANGGSPNHKLTGIVGGDGKRYASFYYSGNRAKGSTHGEGTERTSVTAENGVVTMYEGDQFISQTWTPKYDNGVIKLGQRKEKYRDSTVTRTFDYAGGGLVARQTNYLGVPTIYRYDRDRQLEVERTEAEGTSVARTIRTEWHATFDKPVRIDDGTRWTILVYDAKGNVVERREGGVADAADTSSTPWPSERVTRYSYDNAGRPLSVDGPIAGDDDTTRFAYFENDASGCDTSPMTCAWRKGDLHTTTDALGHAQSVLAYDGAGRVLSSADVNGVRTVRRYDAAGRPSQIIMRARRDGVPSAMDIVSSVTYDTNGAVDTITDPDGATLTHRYNAAHRLVEQIDALGNRHVMDRDIRGLVSTDRYIGADGAEATSRSYEYDEHGLVKVDMPVDMAWKYYNYDGDGRYLGRHGSDLYKEVIERDALGRTSAITQGGDASSITTHINYDGLGRIKTVVDPKGLSTAYLRNGLGDVLWRRSPDTGDTSLENDAAGRPTKETPADGKQIERTFDSLGRPVAEIYADGAETRYTYDKPASSCASDAVFAVGRLSSVTYREGTTTFCYDFAGRIAQKDQVVRGVSLRLNYEYTAAGRIAAVTYPGGRRVIYTRDAAGHITNVSTQEGPGQVQSVLTGVRYDAPGHIAAWTAGVRTIERLHNKGGFVSELRDGSDGLKAVLRYESENEIVGIGTGLAIGVVDVDVATRVTLTASAETTPEHPYGMVHAYAYDKTGDRLSWVSNFATSRKFEYSADSHRLLIANKVSREYDANGNTTRIGDREFVYDASGRMIQVKVNGIAEMNYAYSPLGQQIGRYIAGNTTISLHDEAGHWLGDFDGAGNAIRQIVWLDDLPVAAIDGQVIHDIQPDHLGTPRVVVDRASNKVIWKWYLSGEAFGADAPSEDPDGDGAKYVLNMRFPGQRYDAVTGLFQNGWRDYDPTSGRYIQSDPIGLAGGISTYAYVGSNPYVAVDLFGLCNCGSVIPEHPTGVDLNSNVAGMLNLNALSNVTGGLGQALKYRVFYELVRNNGSWDYKQQGRQYADFGNFHYGVVGRAAGIPEEVLARTAGWAQTRSGNHDPDNSTPLRNYPFGDDPEDQEQISNGMWWYENCYWKP